MKQNVKNFLKYRNLLHELVVRDIKIKYKRSVLGFLWSLLNPLLMMMVLNAVFSRLFRFDIENFVVYLLTGQTVFNFFSEGTNMAMVSIFSNGSLINKVYIPKYIFPLSKVMSSFVNFLFSLVAVLIMMVATKVKFSFTLLFLPFLLIYIFLFVLGVGLILCTYSVFFRDLLYLYGVGLMAWMYLTPIFYPIKIVPEKYQIFFKNNPLFYFIEYFREIVLYSTIPSLTFNLKCLGVSVIILLIGLYVFYKNQYKFILYI